MQQKLPGTRDANGYIPSISFQPDYWSGKPNAPTYYSTYVRGGPGTEQGHTTSAEGIGSDFVVFVLDVPADFDPDYLGSITYDTDWNGLPVWTNEGYPQQFSEQALLPYVDFNFPVNDAWRPGFFQSEHGYAIRKFPLHPPQYKIHNPASINQLTKKPYRIRRLRQPRQLRRPAIRMVHFGSVCGCLCYRSGFGG